MTNPKDKRAGVPLQHVNTYRKNNDAYKEPDVSGKDRSFDHPAVSAAKTVSGHVRDVIINMLGVHGLRIITSEFPNFFDDIEASVVEAFIDGHHTAWGETCIQRGAESQAAVGTEDEENDDNDAAYLYCKECGDVCFLTPEGISHHGEPKMIDYNRDGEHTALPELETEE